MQNTLLTYMVNMSAMLHIEKGMVGVGNCIKLESVLLNFMNNKQSLFYKNVFSG